MAEVIGQNADGTYKVRRPDGQVVDTALPEAAGLSMSAPDASVEVPQSLPPAAPTPVANATPRGPRIVGEEPGLGIGTGMYEVERPDGQRVKVPKWSLAGAPVDDWQRQQIGMAPAQAAAPDDPRQLGDMSPAEAEATRKARGLPAPDSPYSVLGMRTGGASLYAMPSGTGGDNLGTGTAPAAQSAPAAAEPKKLTVDDFAIVQPTAQPAARTSSTSTTIRTRAAGAPSSDAWKKYKEGTDKVQSAAATEAAVAERQASVTLAQQRAEEADLNQRVEEDKLRMAEEQDAMRQSEADMRDVVKEASTPSGEIDPGRWWSSRTTGQKVAAGVSAFLAGFAGTTSPMVTAIEQDIAAQRDMLDRKDVAKRNAVEGQKLLHGMLVDRLKDSRLAYSAHKLLGLEHLRKTFEAQMAETGVPLAKVRGEKAIGELMQAEGVAKAEFQQRAASLRAANLDASLKSMAIQQAQQAATLPKEMPKDLRERLVPTPFGTIPAFSETAANKLRDTTKAFGDGMEALNALIDLRSQGPRVFGENKAMMQSYANKLLLSLKTEYGLGVLSESDEKIVKGVYGGDPDSITNLYSLDVLTRLREDTAKSYARNVELNTGQKVGVKSRVAGTTRGD